MRYDVDDDDDVEDASRSASHDADMLGARQESCVMCFVTLAPVLHFVFFRFLHTDGSGMVRQHYTTKCGSDRPKEAKIYGL